MTKPKKILFECQNLTLTTGTGIATYARNLALQASNIGYETSALYGVKAKLGAKEAALDEIALYDARTQPSTILSRAKSDLEWLHSDPFGIRPRKFEPTGIVIDKSPTRFTKGFKETLMIRNLSERARQHFIRYGQLLKIRNLGEYTALHTTHAVPIISSRCPTLCTIHDIIPLRLPATTLDDKRYFYKLVKKITQKADKIVTVSEQSKRDLIEFFKIDEERVVNTYQSVDLDKHVSSITEDALANDLNLFFNLEYRGYYLFVGAIEPKKNVSRLIEAYSNSGLRRPLILAGNLGWQYDKDVEKMRDERFISYKINEQIITKQKSVRHLNYLPRKHLLRLIRGARALVFPSLYEGFGLPVLEAMALGTPVITSNGSSLPEVAGDAAILVDPFDVNAISQAFKQLEHDDDLCKELSRRGLIQAQKFSPEAYQTRLADLYKGLL